MEGPMEAHIGVEMRRAIAQQSSYAFLCFPYVFSRCHESLAPNIKICLGHFSYLIVVPKLMLVS